jgi:inositol hexakisphosphate/diphosphoinositol-pentakisphosphate kinase
VSLQKNLLGYKTANSYTSVKLPKSFVAIDLSQDDRARTTISGKNKDNGDAKSEESERGRSEERKDEILLPIADENGNVASPRAPFESQERSDAVQLAGLPPPALDA